MKTFKIKIALVKPSEYGFYPIQNFLLGIFCLFYLCFSQKILAQESHKNSTQNVSIEKQKGGLTSEQEAILRRELLFPGAIVFEGKVLDHSNITDGTNTYGVLTLDIFKSYGAIKKCGQIIITTQAVSGKVKNIRTGEVEEIIQKHSRRSEGFGLFSCFQNEDKSTVLSSSFVFETENHRDARLLKNGKYILHVEDYDMINVILPRANICKDVSVEKSKYLPTVWKSSENNNPPKRLDTDYKDFLNKKLEQKKREDVGKNNNKSIQVNVDINYNLANPTVTVSGADRFLEFDVLAFASQAGTFLDNANIIFEYNNGVFGNNIYANNNITVTRGPAFPQAKYPYLFPGDDPGLNNRFGCVIGADLQNPNRTALPNAPILLMHMKMKIATCGPDLNISFQNFFAMQLFAFFSTTVGGANTENYQNVLGNNWPAYKACTPYIESISSSTGNTEFTAGTYDAASIITIKGKFFGQPGAESKLFYSNADDPAAANPSVESETNNLLANGWTDTEIKADVMGERTDNADVTGTGKIRIKNDFNFETVSNQSITILFNLFDGDVYAENPGPAGIKNNQRFRMSKKNVLSQANYQIQVVPALASNARFMQCLKAVVKKWNCTAGTNLEISDQPYLGINPGAADNLTVIYIDNTIGALAVCTNHYEICHKKQTTEFDIKVKLPADAIYEADPSTNVANPQKDVYGLLLHEMGHGIGLNHTINDEEDVMYPFRDNVPPRVAPLKANDISGAIASSNFSSTVPICGGAQNYSKQFPACNQAANNLLIKGYNFSSWCVPGFSNPAINPNIKVTVEGGFAPFTYVWTAKPNNNATIDNVLSASPSIIASSAPYLFSYDLTVIDNSDIPKMVTITITQQLYTTATSNLAMRDALDDNLTTPTPAAYIYESPDLWNRDNPFNVNNPQPGNYTHQQMDFKGSQQIPANRLFLYNKIQNLGCVANPAGTATLKNYWTLAQTGEAWPAAWTTATYNGVDAGKEINTTNYPSLPGNIPLPPINPGNFKLFETPWFPPRPQNFGNDPATGAPFLKVNVCGLSRIESTDNPFHPIIPGEVNGPIEPNVKASNDIVTHNMWVLNPNGHLRPPIKFVDRGTLFLESPIEGPATINLTYDISESNVSGNNWQDIAELSLVFDPDYFQRLLELNIPENGFRFDLDNHRILFSDNHVEIRGLPVNSSKNGELVPVSYVLERFENSKVSTDFEQILRLSVTSDDWKDTKEVIGSNGFYLRFNADNPDGSFDNNFATYYDGKERFYKSELVDTYSFGGESFTLEAQIQIWPDAPEYSTILSWHQEETGGFQYGLQKIDGGFAFFLVLNNERYLSDKIELQYETCYHVAVARQEGFLLFYVNGRVVSRISTHNESLDSKKKELYIGSAEKGLSGFVGMIDEVRIWKEAMEPEALLEWALSNKLEGMEEGLAGLWSFEEGVYAQTTNDATSNRVDLQRGSTDDVDDNDPFIDKPCNISIPSNPFRQAVNVEPGTSKVESFKRKNNLDISLYPNPSNGTTRLMIRGLDKSVEISITNSEGLEFSKNQFDVNEKSFSKNLGEDLKPGVYFIRIKSLNAQRVVKFIKY